MPAAAPPKPKHGPARLQERYVQEILPELGKKFGRTNKLSLPKLTKVVVNMGVGKAIQDKNRMTEAVEHLGFERQNPVGGPRDLRFEFAEFDAGEAHRVDHGLAMHEVLHQALEAGLAHRLRHLDVVAEHVVVLDPECPAAGGLGIARLERGDDLSRILAEETGLVDLGVVARAHETTVAAIERQVVAERGGQFFRERPVRLVEAAGEAGESVR